MARLPFDPTKAHGSPVEPAEADAPAAPPRQLTVSQASELIKATLEQRLPQSIRVVGQMSNFSARNHHWYFSLKDEAAVLHCVAWATSARKFRFKPKDGDELVAAGHVSHYGPQGRTQLYVSSLEPVGAGALDLRFRALCDQLRQLGYFDDARKKPLPIFPRRIAVITSATGAAVQDVITTAAQRCRAIGLLIVDVRVQGEGAAAEIANAIKWVDAHRTRLGVDAMLLTRGGGSIEDLWAFNERAVADAVFNCTLPVVAAIGHESDTTVAELVADVRASTPTQAAMRLVPSAQELCAQIDHLAHRIGSMVRRGMERRTERVNRSMTDLRRVVEHLLSKQHTRVARLGTRLQDLHPSRLLSQRRAVLALAGERLERSVRRRLEQRDAILRMQQGLMQSIHRHVRRQRERLQGMQRHLAALDPEAVLRRGYSITSRGDGALVRSVRDVQSGELIVTRLADGHLRSHVVGGSAESPQEVASPDPTASKASKPRQRPRSPDQMDLFR